LRVLQDGEIKPLGSTKTKTIDVRIISATNKDLTEEIARGQFREDLFYRLNVLPLHLPPLRERPDDVPLLLDRFLKNEAVKMGVSPKRIARDALEVLVNYSWKGNIRELENFVKHIIVVVSGDVITLEDLTIHFAATQESAPQGLPASSRPEREAVAAQSRNAASLFEGYSWDELEKDYVLYLLEKNRWHITRAARDAGVNRSTFDSRMKKLGIRK
jgi:transcriptional regulator with GAF, ATPase, and Fis domain